MRIVDSEKDPLTAPVWDRFVAEDPRGHLLQTWAWGELKGSFGWHPWRVAVAQDGALVAGAQVLYRRFGPLSLAYVPKGPVLLVNDGEAIALLWRAIREHARRFGAIALKVEPEWRDEDAAAHAWLRSYGFRPSPNTIQPRRTVIVDLVPDEEEILARMKPKWRYNIRLSSRKGVEVRSEGPEALGIFYELMRVTGERDGFAIHSRAYYEKALALFAPLGRAQLLVAYYEEQPLAALMPFAFNKQAWYMYGASSNAHRERMPNHQLQWRAMQWAKAQGCTQYDLWGIADVDPQAPTAKLEGVQRFKEGFGGEIVRYVGAYDQPYRPLLHRAFEVLWKRRRLG